MKCCSFVRPVTLVAGLCGLAPVAQAQDDSEYANMLEEIIVTAQKVEENIQVVPLAVTALTGADLAQQGVINILDVANQVPNVEFTTGQGDAGITVRGVTTSQQANATLDDNTAMHVDGFYMTDTAIGGLDFVDVERIEIARGPQGTLWGRNAVAGTVNIISRKPDPEEFDAWAELEASNFETFAVRGGLNIPVGDQAAFRFAGLWRETDGYLYHRVLDRDFLGNEAKAFRGAFRYAGERVQVDVKAEFAEEDGDGQPLVVDPRYAAEAAGAACGVNGEPVAPCDPSLFTLPTDRYDTTALNDGRAEYREEESTRLGLTVDIALTDTVSLKSLTGYQDFESEFLSDLDGFDFNQQWDIFRQSGESVSQELILYSTNEDSRIQWLLAGFYLDYEKGWDIDLFQAGDDRYAPLTSQVSLFIDQELQADATAIFGSVTYALTDQADVRVGLRYNDEEKESINFNSIRVDFKNCDDPGPVEGLTWCQLLPLIAPGSFPVAPTNPFIFAELPNGGKEDWSEVTGDITFRYFFEEDRMAYLRYARGFKSGGFNFLVTPGDQLSTFEPEIVNNYEIGLKADWLDNALRTNITAFFMDFKDQQVNRVFRDADNLPFFTTENAGTSDIMGVEVELDAILNENWRIDFTGAWLDAEYDEYFTVAGNQVTEVDLSGVPMSSAPEFSLQFAANYSTELGVGGRLSVRGEVQHRDEVAQVAPNFDGSEFIDVPRPSYTLLNAFVSYTSQSGRWGVTLFGRNLTDEYYLLSQPGRFTTSTGDVVPRFGAPAAPRSYGIKFNFNY